MTLLLDRNELDERGNLAAGALRSLADSIFDDLREVIERPLYLPEQKALLSREGGRCLADGAMLDFDPFSPRSHRCPNCGKSYDGELHDRFWIYWYQLWLAERVLHASVVGALRDAPDAARFALEALDAICDRYPKYPNVDNALGPTRPFFSTYLESIWLLQLCVAADLLESRATSPVLGRLRDAVVEPSLSLIGSFDEGLSNRQVWNNAALIAGHRLLGRDDAASSVVWAESGLVTHLSAALLGDGTWYEGENYHFFAHRGLWYCMELSSRIDAEIPPELVARYQTGFRAPFLTTLPDLTFPSRRDSQYAVSLRQWRFAEMCELGLARADDRILRGMLARLYADDLPPGDAGRWKSTAEAERNIPATRLTRADLGWKSLLFARPSLELAQTSALPSVLLEEQGIGVIRRDQGQVYVALDYGVSGGGHGHPDRLNLLVSDGDTRVLDDMGTGSYVDPSLHWYRSTLAHNAPMFDGRSQARVDGELLAWEDRGGAGWISARAAIARDASATRTVVVMTDYLVDEVQWSAGKERVFDLPLHFDVEAADGSPAGLAGADGLEDGWRFLSETRCVASIAVGAMARFTSKSGQLWLAADTPVDVWTAQAPGAPGKGDRRLLIVRGSTATGTIRWVWSWSGAARPVALFPKVIVDSQGSRQTHERVPHGHNVVVDVGSARSTIDLQGVRQLARIEEPTAVSPSMEGIAIASKQQWEFKLGASDYRRSEQTWKEAGSPTATVSVDTTAEEVRLSVAVNAERTFVPPGSINRLDNENADINGAGIQLYILGVPRRAGYVIVPQSEGRELAIRPIDGWGDAIAVEGSWKPVGDGYRVDLRFKPGSRIVLLDVVVNEKPAGRERRRGQLVMSGAEGEFVYLRGDRHEISRLLMFPMRDA
jgi:hypothetical protein